MLFTTANNNTKCFGTKWFFSLFLCFPIYLPCCSVDFSQFIVIVIWWNRFLFLGRCRLLFNLHNIFFLFLLRKDGIFFFPFVFIWLRILRNNNNSASLFSLARYFFVDTFLLTKPIWYVINIFQERGKNISNEFICVHSFPCDSIVSFQCK